MLTNTGFYRYNHTNTTVTATENKSFTSTLYQNLQWWISTGVNKAANCWKTYCRRIIWILRGFSSDSYLGDTRVFATLKNKLFLKDATWGKNSSVYLMERSKNNPSPNEFRISFILRLRLTPGGTDWWRPVWPLHSGCRRRCYSPDRERRRSGRGWGHAQPKQT